MILLLRHYTTEWGLLLVSAQMRCHLTHLGSSPSLIKLTLQCVLNIHVAMQTWFRVLLAFNSFHMVAYSEQGTNAYILLFDSWMKVCTRWGNIYISCNILIKWNHKMLRRFYQKDKACPSDIIMQNATILPTAKEQCMFLRDTKFMA